MVRRLHMSRRDKRHDLEATHLGQQAGPNSRSQVVQTEDSGSCLLSLLVNETPPLWQPVSSYHAGENSALHQQCRRTLDHRS